MSNYLRISRTQARTLFRKYGTVYIKINGEYQELKPTDMENYGRHWHAFSVIVSKLLKVTGKKKFEYYELQSMDFKPHRTWH